MSEDVCEFILMMLLLAAFNVKQQNVKFIMLVNLASEVQVWSFVDVFILPSTGGPGAWHVYFSIPVSFM